MNPGQIRTMAFWVVLCCAILRYVVLFVLCSLCCVVLCCVVLCCVVCCVMVCCGVSCHVMFVGLCHGVLCCVVVWCVVLCFVVLFCSFSTQHDTQHNTTQHKTQHNTKSPSSCVCHGEGKGMGGGYFSPVRWGCVNTT